MNIKAITIYTTNCVTEQVLISGQRLFCGWLGRLDPYSKSLRLKVGYEDKQVLSDNSIQVELEFNKDISLYLHFLLNSFVCLVGLILY